MCTLSAFVCSVHRIHWLRGWVGRHLLLCTDANSRNTMVQRSHAYCTKWCINKMWNLHENVGRHQLNTDTRLRRRHTTVFYFLCYVCVLSIAASTWNVKCMHHVTALTLTWSQALTARPRRWVANVRTHHFCIHICIRHTFETSISPNETMERLNVKRKSLVAVAKI